MTDLPDPSAGDVLPQMTWGPLLLLHPLPHFVYDPGSLRLLGANEPALERYGYTQDEFVRLNRAELLAPAELPALRAFLDGLPATAQVRPQRVWRERTRDGRILYADVRGMQVLFEGRPARLAAVVDAGAKAQLAADAEQARDLLVTAGRLGQLGGWSIDLRTGRMDWSDVVCDLHELPRGTERALATALDFYPGQAGVALQAAVDQCRLQGTSFDIELPFVGARGTQRWVRVVGAAVRDDAGSVLRVDGAQQDITARKRTGLALEESRQRFGALLAAIPDLWMVIDAKGCYAEVSDRHHPALSSPWDEKLGRPLVETIDVDLVEPITRLMALAHSSGQPQSHHYEMTVRGGPRRSLEARYVALDGGRTMLLIRDVTEQVLLEQRFELMAQAAPVGIFMTDAAGDCSYTNAEWQRLFGLSLAASLGTGWTAAVHPDDRARVQAAWQESARDVRPFEAEFRVHGPHGVERRVAARSSPIVQADTRLGGHVGTVVDVTQARELEAARQAQALAEATGRQQAAFMSRVSHELRTPLNAILGFGQLLQHGAVLPDARAQLYVGHVVTAGRHMLALVDDLLELQRLEQGALQPQPVPLDLASLLAACADLLRPAAAQAGVTVEVDAAAGLLIVSDERCLRQIMLNLGSNAIKYAGRGAHLTLRARADDGAAVLSVVDNGRGMSPDQVQRLFKPFERLGQEASGQPGSGLGLVITRQIALLLGAEVHIASQLGVGTVATLRFVEAA